jgi:hypothetical protein
MGGNYSGSTAQKLLQKGWSWLAEIGPKQVLESKYKEAEKGFLSGGNGTSSRRRKMSFQAWELGIVDGTKNPNWYTSQKSGNRVSEAVGMTSILSL